MALVIPGSRFVVSLRSVARFRGLEGTRLDRRLARTVAVEDFRKQARRRLPAGVFDYVDGAADDETTLGRNASAFAALEFEPRVLVDVSTVDPSTELFGRRLPIPLAFAPTGFTRMVHPREGESAVARVAYRRGLPYTLSTLSTRAIEEVAPGSGQIGWFQVYMWRDRGLVKELLQRARRAGYGAIMLTVDTAVFGRRRRDAHRGFELPPKVGLDSLIEGARHPRWSWQLVSSDPIKFANVAGTDVGDGSSAVALADYINTQFDSSVSWDDIAWLRQHWSGLILLKGIQAPDDARLAVKAGVDGIVVSNHGGRQLDHSPATIRSLPRVADAVEGALPILCDGGIRNGSDLAKAIALGASAALIGRPYLYALGAAGEHGVERLVDLFEQDLRRVMALLGVDALGQLDRSALRAGPKSTW